MSTESIGFSIHEAKEPVRIKATSVLEVVYEDLVEALRDELQKGDDVTPVFPFEYDWRQDCTVKYDLLDSFVDEGIDRSTLLSHYKGKSLNVDLVAHSMGGLIRAD